jgi:pyruvate ferredoxin oxidoreductase alpha subunit
MKKCIEGSKAVALTVNLCRPDVVSAYPITPQTHIVEELAALKASGAGDYEFVRSDSEFAAASIVLGASAAGGRTYTASSSQGLLLMTEVLFNIAGMRLPVVLTCANRAVSAPINIWNDQQDAVTMRDSGWMMLYAEDNQAAVDMHLLAFKIAEQLKIPVMVNMDGFVLTHTVEPVDVPSIEQVNKFLPKYQPTVGQYLDVTNPVSLGCFVTPADYQEIRLDLHKDLLGAKKVFQTEAKLFKKIFNRSYDLVQYYGADKPDKVIVSFGSVVGTIKEAVDELIAKKNKVGVLNVNCFRPFPDEALVKHLLKVKKIVVLEKDISLGSEGALALEVKKALFGKTKSVVKSITAGLGGRDIRQKDIVKIFNSL